MHGYSLWNGYLSFQCHFKILFLLVCLPLWRDQCLHTAKISERHFLFWKFTILTLTKLRRLAFRAFPDQINLHLQGIKLDRNCVVSKESAACEVLTKTFSSKRKFNNTNTITCVKYLVGFLWRTYIWFLEFIFTSN